MTVPIPVPVRAFQDIDMTGPIFPGMVSENSDGPITYSILCIDNNPADFRLLVEQLCPGGEGDPFSKFNIKQASTLEEGFEAIRERIATDGAKNFDAILLDLTLPDSSGPTTLTKIAEAFPEIPVLIICEDSTSEFAVEMIQLGAQDFLPKDFIGVPELMARSIFYAIERKQALNEKVLLQQQLIQAEKLDSIGRIAAGIAHEVQNPLSTIQIGLNYLTSIAPDIGDENYDMTCHELNLAIDRAVKIVRGMLDLSREETLNLAAGTASDAIDRALELVNYDIKKSQTEILREDEKDLPQLLLDVNKIEQVLINLIRNSIHAMEDSLLRPKRIHVRTFSGASGEYYHVPGLRRWAEERNVKSIVAMEVRDEGPGVEESKLANIFEPFVTSKPVGKGTGLGLSVVWNIVNLHGGFIRVGSMTEPTGLRTRIYFKAIDSGAPPPPKPIISKGLMPP